MKKLLSLLLAAALLVACGGENKKEEEKSVDAQIEYFEDVIMKAAIAEDDAKGEQLMMEFFAWYGGLNEADKAKADALLEESWLGQALEQGFAEMEEEDDLGCGGTVGELAEYYNSSMLDALNNGDAEAFVAIMEEGDAWYESLDEVGRQVADNITAEYEQELQEAVMKVINNPDFAALFAE